MQPELVRISELARRCDVTVRALEVYQRRGLIAPLERAENGYRYYDPTLEEPIRAFGALQSFGAALREVAEIFVASIPLQHSPTPEQARDCMIRAREFYRRHIAQIDGELARLSGLQAGMRARIAYCDEQLNGSGPVKIGRPAAPVRQARPGRIDYRRVTADVQ